MNRFKRILFLAFLAPGLIPLHAADKIPVKVVVLAMFELGKDSGDKAAEFQLWYEREKLTQTYPFPSGYHDICSNGEGLIATVTGIGTARAAASVMALGSDPRFDLTKAYWVVAGIAGINPKFGSLGSAVWSDWVVDGDLGHEIDAREMPKEWTTGFIPRPHSVPYGKPKRKDNGGEVYHLNPQLTEWAYQLTKSVALVDNDVMKKNRARYTDHPEAQKPPRVQKGATLSSSTFWHGKLLNQWANNWVKYWTEDQSPYATTAMEDTGTLQSLTFLAKAGKVDLNRVLVLRTASNFDSQPPGLTAAESLAEENGGSYSAFDPSVEAAYRVGSTVTHELIKNWGKYAKELPSN